METSAERLRKARIDAGYATAKDAVDAFGFKEAAYRHHENGTRAFPLAAAVRYARAYKVTPGYLLRLEAEKKPPPAPDVKTLKVAAAVAAGVWREQTEWPQDEQYDIEVGPSPIPGAERFAVQMQGASMNKVIPPGSDLECLRVGFNADVVPQVGQLVIACREAHGLTEMTCKRLDRDGDEWILRAESYSPEFQEPIRLGPVSSDIYVDNEIRIIGIVVRAQQSHFNPRTS